MRPMTIFLVLLAMTGFNTPAFSQHGGHGHTHSSGSDQMLLERLRAGGNVIFFRHERTNMLIQDAADMSLSDCATQRNLSVTGIAAATENGRYIQELDIPIGSVLASPMCRTLETGRYAFADVEAEPRLMGFNRRTGRDRAKVGADLRALTDEFLGEGRNTVFVAHFSNIEEGFGTRLHEGDAAIIGLDRGQPAVIGVIRANQWSDLVFAEIRAGHAARGHHNHKGHGAAAKDE